MADRFVSADQLEEARRKRQEEWERVRKPDDPEEAPEEEHDSRSLYERLQEARGKKQSEYEEERKMKNMMRGLDSDETDFLSHVDDLKAKQEVLRKKEERELIKKCKERATFKSAGVPSLNKLRPAHSGTGKKAVSEQAQLLGAVIRKRTISDVEDEPKKRKKLVEESALPTNIKVIGVIPGMQQYSPSSDSSNSDSEDDRNSLPVLVQNAGTAKKGNGCEEESDLVMTSQDVASHYNAVPERGLAERTQSRIFYLRNFNNWTKSMLINEFLEKLRKEGCNRPRVLDLCCGKGGDLLKWKQGNISSIVMTDVADISLKQCESRYNEMKDRGRNDRQELFTATFLHADASTERLLPQLESDTQFDIASCQFALHYSFATEEQARQMLQNATENIRTGGYFIGTLPDADVMYWCIKQGENGKYVNDVCSLEYDDKSVNFETHIPPLFGAKFHFTLDQVVNCPEFLVHFDLLVQMMDELGFQLVLRKRFTEAVPYFLKEQGHSARALLGRMQALEPFPPENDAKLMGPEAEYKDARDEIEEKEGKQDWEGNHRTIGTLSKSEWEVASMYLVFAFQRVSQ